MTRKQCRSGFIVKAFPILVYCSVLANWSFGQDRRIRGGGGAFYRESITGDVALIPDARSEDEARSARTYLLFERNRSAYTLPSDQQVYWFIVNHKYDISQMDRDPPATYLAIRAIYLYHPDSAPISEPVFLARNEFWYRRATAAEGGVQWQGKYHKRSDVKVSKFLELHDRDGALAQLDQMLDADMWHAVPLLSDDHSWEKHRRWIPLPKLDSNDFRYLFSPPLPDLPRPLLNCNLIRFFPYVPEDSRSTPRSKFRVVFKLHVNNDDKLAIHLSLFAPNHLDFDREFYFRVQSKGTGSGGS